MIIEFKHFAHGSKSSNQELIREIEEEYEIELSDKAKTSLTYIANEVELTYSFDTESGRYRLLRAK